MIQVYGRMAMVDTQLQQRDKEGDIINKYRLLRILQVKEAHFHMNCLTDTVIPLTIKHTNTEVWGWSLFELHQCPTGSSVVSQWCRICAVIVGPFSHHIHFWWRIFLAVIFNAITLTVVYICNNPHECIEYFSVLSLHFENCYTSMKPTCSLFCQQVFN